MSTVTKLVRKGDFVCRSVADEVILVPIGARPDDLPAIYTLNEVGAAIWASLEPPGHTAAEIVTAICERFEVSAAVAGRDVASFLDGLAKKGMIVAAGVPR